MNMIASNGDIKSISKLNQLLNNILFGAFRNAV